MFFSALSSFQVKREIIGFSWVYQNLGITLGALNHNSPNHEHQA